MVRHQKTFKDFPGGRWKIWQGFIMKNKWKNKRYNTDFWRCISSAVIADQSRLATERDGEYENVLQSHKSHENLPCLKRVPCLLPTETHSNFKHELWITSLQHRRKCKDVLLPSSKLRLINEQYYIKGMFRQDDYNLGDQASAVFFFFFFKLPHVENSVGAFRRSNAVSGVDLRLSELC